MDFYLFNGVIENDTDDYLVLCQRVRALKFHLIDYTNNTHYREDTMDGPGYYGYDLNQKMSDY